MEVSQMASSLVSRAVTATVLMAAGLGSVQAAEKIRWEDLQERLYQLGELRSVNVVTRDGIKHHANRLTMAADHLSLYDHQNIQDVLRHDVLRVEIRRRKRYCQHIGENVYLSVVLPVASLAEFAHNCEAGICVWGLLLTPPLWAYTAASAPVFLAADGVFLLVPAKTFEIVEG
jgi:hypothetical protein